MVSQEGWFTVHTADSGGSLTPSSGPRPVRVGFKIDPEVAPAVKAAFEEAVLEMQQARRAMDDMRYLHGGTVNPVVDKYAAALAETGFGDRGSVTTAAESAIAEYQNVIEQLDRVVAGYEESDDEAAGRQNRLRS